MPQTNDKHTPKMVFEAMNKGERKTFLFSLNLALMVVLVFAVAIFIRISLYILIPFLLIPWAYASMVMILDKKANESSAPGLFLSSFGLYYRNGVFGSYRLIRNFFVSYAIAILGSALAGFIYYEVAGKTNADFLAVINQASFYMQNGDYESFYALLNTTSAFTEMTDIVFLTEFSIFFAVFIHDFGVYGMNAMARTAIFANVPVNQLFTRFIKGNWRAFFKMYYGYMWPLLIVEFGGGVGGYFLATLIPGLDRQQDIIFGVGLALVLLSFTFGYYVQALKLMQKPFSKLTMGYLFKESQKAFGDPRFTEQMNDEEKAEMEKNLDEMKKALDDENNDCNSNELNNNSDTSKEDKDDEN